MAVVVIVGAQWGDEGKGKIVDLLTQKAHAVVRWAGGANAGHTLVVEGKKYVTHVIPSGVLRKGVACVLGEGMVIDPNVLVEEIRTFRGHGLIARDQDLVVAERAHLTLPYHKEMDRLREELPGKIGTTKRGIGPTYESKAARSGIRVGDLMRPERLRALLARNVAEIAPTLQVMGGAAPSVDQIASDYLKLGEEIRPFVRDASRFVYDQIRAGRNVLFEGAQGVLLDLDHGTYPFVTSSSTTAGGACSACGIGPTSIDTVMGISKAYATRVGLGAFTTELLDATGELLRKRGNEFGSTTGRPRRCGWLDIPALRLAIRLSGIGGLAITKVDVLSGLDRIKICVAYQMNGRRLEEMPLDLDDLAASQPIYEEMPGWPETTDGAELPANAQRYLARISELCGIPIWMTSVGPGRSQTLVSQDLFGAISSDTSV